MILLNGKKVIFYHFPNKEVQLGEKLREFVTDEEFQRVTLRYENDLDLFHLMIVKKWLDESGFENVTLHIPYLPYSRMDRKVSDFLFTLNYVADYINFLNFTEVYILEPHSKASLDLINNSHAVSVTRDLIDTAKELMKFDPEKDVIVFPDAGAKKRYVDLLNEDEKHLQCKKERNFETGDLNFLVFEELPDKQYERALIVDDLCSRGGTFILVASACREIGIKEVNLAVTHLEENVFSGRIFSLINNLYSTTAIEPLVSSPHLSLFPNIRVFNLPEDLHMTIERGLL